MLWKQFSRRSISPQNKENLNQQVITRRRDSKISNRYHDNSSQLTIIENYQIPKQPKVKALDPLFDETLWKCNSQDLTLKLLKESIIDKTAAFKEIYIVGKQIGSGSYASVRLCADKLTLKSYALKIYNKSGISSSRQKSILREIRILQMVKHPNIINVYNVIETNNHINLLLEYIDGKQLNTLKGYNLKQALYQIASALNYLHARHITHRDVKIENILYSDGQVKLIDFGFSTLFSNSVKKKIYCGTPNYMAPEIVTKQYYRGPPADIWAFGIVIFYLTQGYFPFKGQNDKELFQLIMQCKINFNTINDIYLQDLLYQMLQFDPEDRISATEILLHPWFLEQIKPIKNNQSQKSSCSKIHSPKQINPYQQYQSTVKKNDKASIEYQLDQSQIRRGIVQSYMSSVASTKSPILRRRDSGNQTFDRSSNSFLLIIIRKREIPKFPLLKSFKNRNQKDETQIAQCLQKYNYCRDMIQKEGFQKFLKFCEFLYLTIRKPGDILLKKGDLGQKFYLILKGTVSLIYYNPKNKKAQRLLQDEKDCNPNYEDTTLFQSYIFKELHVGDHFGDLALIDEGIVSSTIICKTDCEFACMDKQHFWKFVGKNISLLDKIKLLRQCSLFEAWTDGELRALSFEFHFQIFHHNQIVFSQGSENLNIYVVSCGFAELMMIKNGQQYLISRIDYGQVFGDDLQINQSTVKCGSPKLEVYAIQKQIIQRFFEQRLELKHIYEEQSIQKRIWRTKRLEQLIQIEQIRQQKEQHSKKSSQNDIQQINNIKELKTVSVQTGCIRRISNYVDTLDFEQKQLQNRQILIKFNKISPNQSVEYIGIDQQKKNKDIKKKEQQEQQQMMSTVSKLLQEYRAIVHSSKLKKIKSSRSLSQNQQVSSLQSPKSSNGNTGINFFITPRRRKQFLVQGIPLQK